MRFKEMFESSDKDIKKLQKVMENHLKKNGFDPKQLEIKIDSSSWDTRHEEFHFSINTAAIGYQIDWDFIEESIRDEFTSNLLDRWKVDGDEYEEIMGDLDRYPSNTDIIISKNGKSKVEIHFSKSDKEYIYYTEAAAVVTSLFVRGKSGNRKYSRDVKALDLDKYL